MADAGLMGIRCVFGADHRCTNGPARGMTLADLRDPVVSIRVAEQIMRGKRAKLGRRALDGYNGDADGSNGYAAKPGQQG